MVESAVALLVLLVEEEFVVAGFCMGWVFVLTLVLLFGFLVLALLSFVFEFFFEFFGSTFSNPHHIETTT